jgi:TonB-linked SusC/RagA family outer membrane protein
MRTSAFLILLQTVLLQLVMAHPGEGQSLKDKVSIGLYNEPLSIGLKKIEKQSGFRVAYAANEIDRFRVLSIDSAVRTIHSTLDLLLFNTHLYYKVSGNKILILQKKDQLDAQDMIKETAIIGDTLYTIKGKVLNKDGQPMAGTSVAIKGTNNGTNTNEQGSFSLTYSKVNPVLVVSFIGYETQEIAISKKNYLEITLVENVSGLNDVVVVGYQQMERRKTTGAVVSIKGKDIENTPYATFDAMLQGRLPGLTVLSTSGEPGANNIVNIRGSSSVDPYSVSNPLYVIDGIVFDLNDVQATYGNNNPLSVINPNDIETIDVLKDASSAAIYGARAANGVIIIKTKKPAKGRAQIRVSGYKGISDKPALKPTIVGAAERRLKMDILKQMGDYLNKQNLSLYLTDSLNPAFNNNTDWQGLFLQSASISNIDASVAAAADNFSYRLSLNGYKEEGVMIGYDYQRMNPRFSLTAKPAKNFEISADVFMGFVKAKHGSGDGSRYPFSTWGFPSSFWQITETDKEVYTGRYDQLRDDDRQTSFNGNTKAMLTVTKGLLLTSSFSFNMANNRRDYLRPAIINSGRNDAQSWSNQSRRWELENYLTYNITYKDIHNFTFLAGQGVEENVNNNMYARGNGVLDGVQTIVGVPAGSGLTASTIVSERARASFFGRIGYNFDGKYLFQANYRVDGSSRYGKNKRWGQFPSVSAGWIISDEKFFAPFTNIVSTLKLRASYGITGMDPGSYYAQYLTLTTDGDYDGASLGAGATGDITTYNGVTLVHPLYGTMRAPAIASAQQIGWESSPQTNLGADLSLFRNRISLSVDWYVRDSKDKVFNVPLPVTSGFSQISNNFVDIRNTGVEINLNTNNLSARSKVQWRTNINIAFNKNYVLKLPNGGRDFAFGPAHAQTILTVGEPLFNFKVWDVLGIYSTREDVPVDPLTGDRLRWRSRTGAMFDAGDVIRRDLNGDYIIDDLDRVNKGNPYPKVVGGMTHSFSYKSFTLDVLSSFILGRSLWNGYLSDKMQDAVGTVYEKWGRVSGPAINLGGLNIWQQPGDHATYPGYITDVTSKWHIAQSHLVENASFFRIKNIRLGYTLPENLTKKIKLNRVRFYGMLDNIWVLTGATVPDPEVVSVDGYSSGNDYPIPKKVTIGFEINF